MLSPLLLILATITYSASAAGVQKCLYCIPGDPNNCQNPTEKTCQYADTDTKTYKCQTWAYRTDDVTKISRICVEDDTQNPIHCSQLNKTKGNFCKMCDSNLCNNDSVDLTENVNDPDDPANIPGGSDSTYVTVPVLAVAALLFLL